MLSKSNATRRSACAAAAGVAYAFTGRVARNRDLAGFNRQFFDGQEALALDDASLPRSWPACEGIGGRVRRPRARSRPVDPHTIHVAGSRSSRKDNGPSGFGARAGDAWRGLGFRGRGQRQRRAQRTTPDEVRYVSGAETNARVLLGTGRRGQGGRDRKGSAPSGARVSSCLGRD